MQAISASSVEDDSVYDEQDEESTCDSSALEHDWITFENMMRELLSSCPITNKLVQDAKNLALSFRQTSYNKSAKELLKELVERNDRKKVTCKGCGATFQKRHIDTHLRSRRHLNRVQLKKYLERLGDNVNLEQQLWEGASSVLHSSNSSNDDEMIMGDEEEKGPPPAEIDADGEVVDDIEKDSEELDGSNASSSGEEEEEEVPALLYSMLRPEQNCASYTDLTTRLLYSWWTEHQGCPLSINMLAELLSLMAHPDTDSNNAAPTPFHLGKAGTVFTPSLPVQQSEAGYFHYPIIDVVSLLLRHKDTTKNWRYTHDLSETGHPCSSMCWAETQQEFAPKLRSGTHMLLFFTIFIDEYRRSLAQNVLLNAIVLKIANNYDEKWQFLLAILPPTISILAYLEYELVPFVQKLEDGAVKAFFYPTNQVQLFCGTLFSLIGDHVGQVKCAGIPSAIAKSGADRYLLLPTSELSEVRSLEAVEAARRDPVETYEAIKRALAHKQFGTKAAVNKTLREVGLEEISPLWKLRIFRKNFFQHFGQCRLHLILLGHVKKVLLIIGLVNGWNWCQTFNSYVAHHRYKKHLRFPKFIYYLASKGSNSAKKVASQVSLLAMTGSEHFSVAKILCEKEVWESLTARHQKLVLSLLKLITVTFDLSPKGSDATLFDIIQNYRSDLASVADDIPKDDQYLTRPWQGFNINFPNNSSLESIPDQIDFLGSLANTDTSMYESNHKIRRQLQQVTNQKNLLRDVLRLSYSSAAVVYMQQFDDDAAEQEFHQLHSALKHHPEKVPSKDMSFRKHHNGCDGIIDDGIQTEFPKYFPNNRLYGDELVHPVSGFTWNGTNFHVGDWLEVSNGSSNNFWYHHAARIASLKTIRPVALAPGQQEVHIREAEADNNAHCHWVELHLYDMLSTETGHAALKEAFTLWLPATVCQTIFLSPLYVYSYKENLYVNTHLEGRLRCAVLLGIDTE